MNLKTALVVLAFQLIVQGATTPDLWKACVTGKVENKTIARESLQPFCVSEFMEDVELCSGIDKPDACRNEASNADRQNHDIKIERATNESLIYNQKTRTLCCKAQLINESKAGVYRGVMADLEIGKFPYEYTASLGCVLKRPVAIEILESLMCCVKFPDNWTIPVKEDHLRVTSHAIPMTPYGHVTDSGYLKLSDLEKPSESVWQKIQKEDHLRVTSHAIPMTPNGNVTDSGYLKLSDLENSSKSDRQKTREYVLSFFFGARGIVGLVTVITFVAMGLVIFICCMRQKRKSGHGACRVTGNQSTSKTAGSCKSQAESHV